MTIRPARRAEIDAIARLDREVFAQSFPAFSLRQFHDLDPELLLVAEDDGRLAGHALGALGRDGEGWVLVVALAAEARGKGLGRALLAAICAALERAGARRIRATVAPGNAASRAMLAATGFEPLAEEKDYFGPGEDRLVMARPGGRG
ncbi:MAG: GNAT family N-acetyltransferase [Planctomycetes bacterium]|nr:GNAT family N-acetyltransferase [Planctomycetota bacterium]